ncbi:hypothetical protein VKT23_008183 [Stygiomarasmius scandens]|uniref:Uncharacterized protein n=1 Tax=Marasmiellus scandens TaxID=2682957 RepID=A0ABR1JLS3_9AGAR
MYTTSEDVEKDPSILLHGAKPSYHPIHHALEGKVGAVISDSGYFVISPNMDVLYAPAVELCRTRMWKNRHFGKDDPLYFPQPYAESIGHLAVIPLPSLDVRHEHALAWHVPSKDEFSRLDPSKPYSGLGTLHANIITQLQEWSEPLLQCSREASVSTDHYVREGRNNLGRLLDFLDVPMSCEECFLRLACLQCQSLELLARLNWLEIFYPRLKDRDFPHSLEPQLMGAFVDNQNDADKLFKAGIPIWVVRSVEHLPATRIDKKVDLIDESANNLILIRNTDNCIDASDAEPPHRVIHTGLPNKRECYQVMSRYVEEQYSFCALGTFGAPSSSISSAQPSSSTHTHDRMLVDVCGKGEVESCLKKDKANEAKRKAKHLRNHPYPTHNRKSTADQRTRNKFILLSGPLNPPMLQSWSMANLELAPLTDYIQEIPQTGYYLPEPESLIASSSESIRTRLLLTWLKLRDIFLYRLSSSRSQTRLLKNAKWRSVLELGNGLQIGLSKGRTTKVHQDMLKLLNKYLEDPNHGIQLQLQNVSSSLPKWQNQTLSNSEMPAARAVREILWELSEINFRLELLTLDGHMHQNKNWMDRFKEVRECWHGLVYRPDPNHANRGLGALSLSDRVPYLQAFYNVLCSWPGEKPEELKRSFPQDLGLIEAVELAMTRYYARSFLNVFTQPAILPRYL